MPERFIQPEQLETVVIFPSRCGREVDEQVFGFRKVARKPRFASTVVHKPNSLVRVVSEVHGGGWE